MTDLISRSAALEDAELIDWYHINQNGRLVSGSPSEDVSYVKFNDVISMLKNAPAVDAVPVVHAKWTEDGECTRCGCTAEYTEYATERYDYDWDENLVPCGIEYHRTYHTTDYCPTCGARMDGEEDAAD